MKLQPFNLIYLPICVLSAALLAGCAGAKVTQEAQVTPSVAARPNQVVVYPFAVSSNEVTLNQGIGSRLLRGVSGTDENAEQLKLAHETAASVCNELAKDLSQKGFHAVCQKRGVPVSGDNVLVVDGEFRNINEGNRLRRMIIGFGAGASTLDTDVVLSQHAGDTAKPLLEFTTHADSGKMPGVAVTGPAGAAAGASAAAAIGANVAMAGGKTLTSATSYLAGKTADQIVQQINRYFASQGW